MAVTNVRYVVNNPRIPGTAIEYTYAFDTSLINLDVIKAQILKCKNWQEFDEVIAANVKIQEVSHKILEIKNGSLDLLPRNHYLTALAQSIWQKLKWGGDRCIIWHNDFFSLLKRGINRKITFTRFKKLVKESSTKTKILTKQDDLLWSIFRKSDDFKRLYYQLQLNKQKVSLKKCQEFKMILNSYNKDTSTLEKLADLFWWFTPRLKRKWQQEFFNKWLQNMLQVHNLSMADLNQCYERKQEEHLEHDTPD